MKLSNPSLGNTRGVDTQADEQSVDDTDQRAEVRGRTSTRPPFAAEVPGDRDAELRLLDRKAAVARWAKVWST